MPLEAFDEAARLGGGEGFLERRGLVGVEVVLHEDDLHRIGEMRVGLVPESPGMAGPSPPCCQGISSPRANGDRPASI